MGITHSLKFHFLSYSCVDLVDVDIVFVVDEIGVLEEILGEEMEEVDMRDNLVGLWKAYVKDRIDVRVMKSDTFMFVYVFELLC